MTAQIIPTKQDDAIGVLRDLIELVKNPDVIVQAHELAREQNKLTTEQQDKLVDARKTLADYDSKIVILSQESEKIRQEKLLHEDTVRSFNVTRDAETERLKKLADEIDRKSQDIECRSRKLLEDAEALNDRKTTMDTEYNGMMEIAREHAQINERARLVNEQKARELHELENELKQKAARLRDSAAGI